MHPHVHPLLDDCGQISNKKELQIIDCTAHYSVTLSLLLTTDVHNEAFKLSTVLVVNQYLVRGYNAAI